VQTVSSPDSNGHRHASICSVAVVSSNDLALARIRETLSAEAIVLLDCAADVAELSADAAGASAVVLTCGRATTERQALIRAVGEQFPDVPIVVIAPMSGNGVHKSLEAGAAGLVLDSEIENALAATIRAVCTGQIVVPQRFRRNATRPVLSHREKETLALLATGLTNRQIAARLYLAESTVKTHLTSIFGKLGVVSRSEAAALVLDPDLKLGLTLPGFSPAVGAHENGSQEL
jgi:DNA-binding NarL/FixJ family response regulator